MEKLIGAGNKRLNEIYHGSSCAWSWYYYSPKKKLYQVTIKKEILHLIQVRLTATTTLSRLPNRHLQKS